MFPHLSSLDVLLLLGCGGSSRSGGILGLCLLGELLLLVLAHAVGRGHGDITGFLGLSLLLGNGGDLLLDLGGLGLEGLLGLGNLGDLGDPACQLMQAMQMERETYLTGASSSSESSRSSSSRSE